MTQQKSSPPVSTVKNELKLLIDKSGCSINIKHYLACFLWLGWPGFYFSLFLILPICYKYSMFTFTCIIGLIVISAILPCAEKYQPKFFMDLGGWMMLRCCEYFSVKVYSLDIDAVNNSGPAIFTVEPHDVLPCGMHSFSDYCNFFTGHKTMGCVTSAIFRLPIMRHFLSWASASSAEKSNIEYLISKGYSPAICPGGVQEVLNMKSNKECVLFLNSRKGIVKLAIKHGLPLIPCFIFGQRKAFKFWVPQHPIMKMFSRFIGFVPMMYFGLFNLPFAQPKSTPLVNIIGKPIIVNQNSNPTKEEVEKVQKQFIGSMIDIFETNKDQFDMKGVKLRII
jgi:2-acylglycerol O-acyltransferase 2